MIKFFLDLIKKLNDPPRLRCPRCHSWMGYDPVNKACDNCQDYPWKHKEMS